MSPEFARILTVAIYLLTTLVWLRDGGKWTWGRRSILGAGILLLAATDRYFGFSHMLCDFLRKAAQEQGWYEARRWLQTIATLLIVSGIVALALIYARFNSRNQSGMRITARAIFLFVLLGFCCLRALSNHFIDAGLAFIFVGLRVSWIIEWLLLGMVIFCSYRPILHAT
jgi:hypothetical protein